MLYYLFDYLDRAFNLPGAGLFDFISFRSGMAFIVSLLISLLMGKSLINVLRRLHVGERIRDLGLAGQKEKQGTPTMGGLIIIGAILLPTLLFAQLHNIYVLLMIVTTLWCGLIGFIDDYIKVFRNNKKGLAARFKLIGQISLGILIGSVLYFHEDVVIWRPLVGSDRPVVITDQATAVQRASEKYVEAKAPITTIPFVKNHELNYARLISWAGPHWEQYTWIVYILVVVLIIAAVSNGSNITDGLDGLATGTSAISGAALALFAYVSGNILLADYLNIMYIPNSGELVVFSAAFIGACIGFLWYNAYPAQVFMGDSGSLVQGGIIATLAILVRKELLIPILCGIFLIENLSVLIQVGYFKYTKKRYGTGRRVFRMAPLHHHYQLLGYAEPKIVIRFWIVAILLAVFTLVTLKIR